MYAAGSPFNAWRVELCPTGEKGAKAGRGDEGAAVFLTGILLVEGAIEAEREPPTFRCDEDEITGMPGVAWRRGSY
jgi:hypothetical protein